MKRVKIRFNSVAAIGKVLRFDEDIEFEKLISLVIAKLGQNGDITQFRLMLGNDIVVEETSDIDNGDDLVLQKIRPDPSRSRRRANQSVYATDDSSKSFARMKSEQTQGSVEGGSVALESTITAKQEDVPKACKIEENGDSLTSRMDEEKKNNRQNGCGSLVECTNRSTKTPPESEQGQPASDDISAVSDLSGHGSRNQFLGHGMSEIYRGPPDDDLSEFGGWPPGWIKTIVMRQGTDTKTKGNKDRYWYSPSGKKYRSLVQIKRALSDNKPESSPATVVSGSTESTASPEAENNGSSRGRRRRSGAPVYHEPFESREKANVVIEKNLPVYSVKQEQIPATETTSKGSHAPVSRPVSTDKQFCRARTGTDQDITPPKIDRTIKPRWLFLPESHGDASGYTSVEAGSAVERQQVFLDATTHGNILQGAQTTLEGNPPAAGSIEASQVKIKIEPQAEDDIEYGTSKGPTTYPYQRETVVDERIHVDTPALSRPWQSSDRPFENQEAVRSPGQGLPQHGSIAPDGKTASVEGSALGTAATESSARSLQVAIKIEPVDEDTQGALNVEQSSNAETREPPIKPADEQTQVAEYVGQSSCAETDEPPIEPVEKTQAAVNVGQSFIDEIGEPASHPRKVFVSGLFVDTKPTDVKAMFRSCGKVTSCKLFQFPGTGRQAIVVFDTEDSAKKALELSGTKISVTDTKASSKRKKEKASAKREVHLKVTNAMSRLTRTETDQGTSGMMQNAERATTDCFEGQSDTEGTEDESNEREEEGGSDNPQNEETIEDEDEEEEESNTQRQSDKNELIPGLFSQQTVTEILRGHENEVDEYFHQKADDQGQAAGSCVPEEDRDEPTSNSESRKQSRRKSLKKGHYNFNIMSLVVEAAATSKSNASKASTFQLEAQVKGIGRNGKRTNSFRCGIQWFKGTSEGGPRVHWPDPSFELWRSVDKPLSSFICKSNGYRWFDQVHDAKMYACLSFLFKHTEQFGSSPALRHFLEIPDVERQGDAESDENIASYGMFVLPKQKVFAVGVRSVDGTIGHFLLDEEQRRASDIHNCSPLGLAKRYGVKSKKKRPFRGIANHFGPLGNLAKDYKGSSFNVLVRWANGSLSQEPLDSFAKYAWEVCHQYAEENGLLETDGWTFLRARKRKQQTRKPGKKRPRITDSQGGSGSKRQRRSQARGESSAEMASK